MRRRWILIRPKRQGTAPPDVVESPAYGSEMRDGAQSLIEKVDSLLGIQEPRIGGAEDDSQSR